MECDKNKVGEGGREGGREQKYFPKISNELKNKIH
jgi:hypothetical protein